MNFDELLNNDNLLDALWDMHFERCTPIQEQAIPHILDGYDLLACAQTGTGKTAAYVLPVIDLLSSYKYPDNTVNCVIMAPTRELAQQIDQQLQGFSYFLPISSMPVYGGTDGKTYEQQRKSLKMGADIVIATPGRLISHIQMGYVDLSKVSFFILDEADRMLDMGFFDDIMSIESHLPKERQTLLFSATMPPKIRQLAKKILYKPMEINIAVSKPADKINQSAFVVYENQKIPLVLHLFKSNPPERVIIFSGSKLKVKQIARTLAAKNVRIGEMHSDLDQKKREDVILDFKAGRINILVATDIMSRGIDIDDITTVINFDVPHESEDYVHRVGRTARADRNGEAITLISREDIFRFKRIEKFLGYELVKNDVPKELGETPSYSDIPSSRNRGRGGERSSVKRQHGAKQVKGSNRKSETPSPASASAQEKGSNEKNSESNSEKRRYRSNRRRNSSKKSES